MSDPTDVNPYQAPASGGLPKVEWSPQGSAGASSGLTPRTIDYLRQTQPWVRFLSIMAFLWFAVMMVVVLVLLGRSTVNEELPTAIMATIYGIYGLIALPPAIYLGRYASGIARFRLSSEPYDLESAIRAQKSYWRFAGVIMLVFLALCVFSIIVFVLSPGPWMRASGPRSLSR